jgi:hypothetical protein
MHSSKPSDALVIENVGREPAVGGTLGNATPIVPACAPSVDTSMPDTSASLLPVTATCQSPWSLTRNFDIMNCYDPDGVAVAGPPYAGTVCIVMCGSGPVPTGVLRCVGTNVWSSVSCVESSKSLASTLSHRGTTSPATKAAFSTHMHVLQVVVMASK